MAKLNWAAYKCWMIGVMTLVALTGSPSYAQAAVDKITTYKDAKGWKLQRNGEDFYVKGVVWGYTPRGANYSYNLWDQSEEHIKNVLDHDFGLMAAAGITANRSFTIIPPKWVSYIYEKHDIMSVINPLMGRYGTTIDGTYVQFTDYSNPRTREVLKAQVMEIVKQYKEVPGVLMFALGNESNYGLSWASFEIENLPVGEQFREKAKFLYSLFGETIREGKQIAPDHLFTIVNGDIQYLDLIAEYSPEMDVLGVNAYRGISFENAEDNVSMWRDVKDGLDLPVVFMEFGSDAFNARDFAEDQAAQANYLRGQWHEIYRKSYGNGEEGNAIGGFVFEWRDEWWKYKQTENLDIQDRTASWANGGYKFDHVEGQNNMNEEWFGITRLGDINEQGVYVAEPRMAYEVLAEVWRVDPYSAGNSTINQAINNVDMELYSLKNDVRALREAKKENDKFRLIGGSFKGEYFIQGFDSELTEDGENGLSFADGQMANFDFAFQPTNRIKGDFTVNLLANVADSNFEFRYGDRGEQITIEEFEDGEFRTVRKTTSIDDNERVEIYDFKAFYEDNDFDLEFFYHTPRYHWGDEGDTYGLLRETTDMAGQDIWNAKAPYGFEYVGKGAMDGLKVVAGPEVYWGANPKAIFKYRFGLGDKYTFMFAEDIAQREESSSNTEATVRQSRQATLYGKQGLPKNMELEWGGIIASTEKIDDRYDRLQDGNIIYDKINFKDTLGAKAKLKFDAVGGRGYVALEYAGLVADGGAPVREFDTELPYSELGNKRVFEAGVMFHREPHMFYPRVFYRDNLIEENPKIDPVTSGTVLTPGLSPRNQDDDPFAVLDNRQTAALEFYYTYDPTPATWFYDWDIDMKEDAPFAFNIGITGSSHKEATDAHLYFSNETNQNALFSDGLKADDLWLLKSKTIWNPEPGNRLVLNWYIGTKQSTGQPDQKTLEFFSVDGKWIKDRAHIYSAAIKIDDFGPYDFYKQFNLVYPLQVNLGYSYLIDKLLDDKNSSQIGVKFFYRELDELSDNAEYQDGKNDYMLEVQTYFELKF